MLSAVICSALGYPAFTVGTITGIPQITKADFRHCSTGISCSQAPFYLYTQGPIFARPEETFACLRYLLGGLRPIETVYLRLSLWPIEGGLLRLPPKLRRKSPKPIPGNNKAS
ncbi:hypothetical protein V6N11_019254 [Hibiscus sabdariffa]|uniref:Uncharacterized protein n=2 Tax=Hibiscus sabdariffa TaxID=183260 RepID=A0ABR2BCI3_9ROSI